MYLVVTVHLYCGRWIVIRSPWFFQIGSHDIQSCGVANIVTGIKFLILKRTHFALRRTNKEEARTKKSVCLIAHTLSLLVWTFSVRSSSAFEKKNYNRKASNFIKSSMHIHIHCHIHMTFTRFIDIMYLYSSFWFRLIGDGIIETRTIDTNNDLVILKLLLWMLIFWYCSFSLS